MQHRLTSHINTRSFLRCCVHFLINRRDYDGKYSDQHIIRAKNCPKFFNLYAGICGMQCTQWRFTETSWSIYRRHMAWFSQFLVLHSFINSTYESQNVSVCLKLTLNNTCKVPQHLYYQYQNSWVIITIILQNQFSMYDAVKNLPQIFPIWQQYQLVIWFLSWGQQMNESQD